MIASHSDNLITIAEVAIAVPVRRLFDYKIEQALTFDVLPGMRVKVPFGSTFKIGIVVNVKTMDRDNSDELAV